MDMKFANALQGRYQKCMQAITADIETLKAASREDEANMQKAARNVYGIFLQLLGSIQDEVLYTAQFDKLREAWQQAYESAQAHGDFAGTAMEETKLAALAKVQAIYTETLEEVMPDGTSTTAL